MRFFPPPEEVKKHLKNLNCTDFSHANNTHNNTHNTIYLEHDDLNDYGFVTMFNIKIDNQKLGRVRIGFIGQTTDQETRNSLPRNFTHLQLPFFSCVVADSEYITDPQTESLKYLLNDTELMSPQDKADIANEEVYKQSLSR